MLFYDIDNDREICCRDAGTEYGHHEYENSYKIGIVIYRGRVVN